MIHSRTKVGKNFHCSLEKRIPVFFKKKKNTTELVVKNWFTDVSLGENLQLPTRTPVFASNLLVHLGTR